MSVCIVIMIRSSVGVCACVFSCINQRQIKCSNSFPGKSKITSNKLLVFSLFFLAFKPGENEDRLFKE